MVQGLAGELTRFLEGDIAGRLEKMGSYKKMGSKKMGSSKKMGARLAFE
jgi:hypothetical protein